MSEPTVGPGVRLSGHLVTEEIGAGGFSRVFRAEPADGGPPVAIKVAIRPEFVSALRAEGAALRRLQGPRFVKVLEEHLDADPPHFVLELCEGGDLRSLLERSPGKRLPAEQVMRLALGILEGAALVHEAGLVHGDLKPENILLDHAGEPRIADLGLSRASRKELLAKEVELSATLLSGDGRLRGTLDYLAPELRRGEDLSPRSDVFALGVLLYEMLVGERPLGRFRLPGGIAKDGREIFDAMVARALASDPRERHADASSMLADAWRLELDRSGPRRRRARFWHRLGLLTVFLVFAGALGLLLWIVKIMSDYRTFQAELPWSLDHKRSEAQPWRTLRPSIGSGSRAEGLVWATRFAEVRPNLHSADRGRSRSPRAPENVFIVLHASVTNESAPGSGRSDAATILRSFVRLRDEAGHEYPVDVPAENYVEDVAAADERVLMAHDVKRDDTLRFVTVFEVPSERTHAGLMVLYGREDREKVTAPLSR